MKNFTGLCFLFTAIAFLSGCTSTQHDWGNYSKELYTFYNNPTDKEKQELSNELEKIFARMEKQGRTPPPGLYAEYGTFLFDAGDHSGAIHFYQKEKQAWPESQYFMDALINALSKNSDTKEDS